MNPRILSAAAFLVLSFFGANHLQADPAEAEDTSYRMAKKYVDKGFALAPTDHSGVTGAGSAIEFLIPVNKGLDYVFLVGTDRAARDVDIYVYDDVGGLILDDRRPGRLAGVQFRSSYNGTAKVYMHMSDAIGLASWYVLVGRRGTIRPETGAPAAGGTAAADASPAPSVVGP